MGWKPPTSFRNGICLGGTGNSKRVPIFCVDVCPKWTDLPRLDAEEILRLAKAFTHREVLDGERIVSQGVVQMGR